MNSSQTLGQRVGFGFAAVVVLGLLSGGFAIYEVTRVREAAHMMSEEFVPEARHAAQLEAQLGALQLETQHYRLTAEEDRFSRISAQLQSVREQVQALHSLAEAHPHLVKLRSEVGVLDEQLEAFETLAKSLADATATLQAGRASLEQAGANFDLEMDHLQAVQFERFEAEAVGSDLEHLRQRGLKMHLAQQVAKQLDHLQMLAAQGQLKRDPALIRAASTTFDSLFEQLAALRAVLEIPADIAEVDRLTASARAYRDNLIVVAEQSEVLNALGVTGSTLGHDLQMEAEALALTGMDRTVEAAEESTARLNLTVRGVVASAALLTLLGIVISTRVVSRLRSILLDISSSLAAGAQQLVSASGQISTASNQVADSASRGAAALQQTGASMEELASLVRRTADDAGAAMSLAGDARHASVASGQKAERLNEAMGRIKSSSDEISKIIKTIDEIAFQTNLLALNAAVEAARAGEAGAGFSVVAEEVRALAHRAAKAAKESGEKISHAVRNSGEAASVAGEVTTDLESIRQQVEKVDRLIASIATAAEEQAQGVDQINRAIDEIDQVTQGNAAAAEESASASTELKAEADAVQGLVSFLEQVSGVKKRAPQPASVSAGAPRSGGHGKAAGTGWSPSAASANSALEPVGLGAGEAEFFR
ncbi:methyl-accepting chemotaxis protein [Actomonas aquatica]|uniref:Methyl-accepting chemotaxis protein n=1 Tax=Actomonas aquatica TaxID=2866162 RepID=A0ABZ1C9H4_9BACT|nr:methyl-accepting chemotaxis protein [Opitutus sp. WL0086]WRQ86970.1 methyl-accepting chemotaxis protein [Opitutus sp. WL0086]